MDYSYAFRKLYASYDKVDDKQFGDYIQKKYNLTDIGYRSLQSDVANRIEQTKTNKSKQEERIIDITADLKALSKKEKSNKNTRSKFKKHNKLKQVDDSLSRDIAFGGKKNLRELTKLHNNIPVISKQKDSKEKTKLLADNALSIEEKTKEWKSNRILPIYILGEANQKGNRFFDFNFKDKTIIYKPYQGKKIEIKYSCNKNYQKQLLALQELIDNKMISVTITMTSNKICLSFDNEILSGYYIDTQSRRAEVKELKKKGYSEAEQKDIITQIYKKYYDALKEQKLVGKIKDRYMAVDLNPEYIG